MSSLPRSFAAASLAFLIACLVFPVVAFSQDASLDDIVNSHFKALGGKEAIAKIDNYRSRAKVTMETGFGNMSGTAEEVVDISGKRFYSNLDLGQYKKTEALVGNAGWTKGTDGDREMDAQAIGFAKMSLGISPLVSAYETARGALEVKGTGKFNDKECHILAIGAGIEYCVDVESGLLEGLKIAGVGAITLSDYKAVEGVKFPKKRSLKIDAQGISIDYKFRYTKVNVEVDDDLFGDLADSETSDAPLYSAEQIISFLDKDGDEKISEEEAKASPQLAPSFGLIDTSNDGFIDFAEAKAMVEYMKNSGASPRRKKEKSNGMTSRQVIESMDKNKDGKISKREASEDLKLYFSEFDINKDGFIDEKEGEAVAAAANKRQ